MRGDAILALVHSQPWAVTVEALAAGIAAIEKSIAGDVGPSSLQTGQGKRLESTRSVSYRETDKGKVAVLPITGPIFRHADALGLLCGGVSTATIAKDLAAALDDDEVSSIVIEADSPGGEVSGISELASIIRAGTKRKPVVTYVDGLGASAMYWLASASTSIVASSTARLGSIGVVWTVPKGGSDEKRGLYEIVSSAAPMKRADPSSEKGSAYFQGIVDDLHAVFEGDVARYRGVDVQTVRERFGRGGVLIASKALKAGMIDKIGSVEEVIAELGAGRVPGRDRVRKSTVKGGQVMPGQNASLARRILSAVGIGDVQIVESDDGELLVTDSSQGDKEKVVNTSESSAAASIAASQLAELEKLRAEKASLELGAIQASSLAFADGLIRRGLAVPAERAEIARQDAMLALSDKGIAGYVFTEGVGAQASIVVTGQRPQSIQPAQESFRAFLESRVKVNALALTEDVLKGTATLKPAKVSDEANAEREAAEEAALERYVRSVGAKG